MATPPAVAAICFIRLGCWGWAIADGGAAIGVEGGGGAALGAGAGGARATGALGGGDAARPRRGIFTLILHSVKFQQLQAMTSGLLSPLIHNKLAKSR